METEFHDYIAAIRELWLICNQDDDEDMREWAIKEAERLIPPCRPDKKP